MKSSNGMGIIKLIIMVLFILAIIVTGMYFLRKQYHEVRIETIKTDMLQVQWRIKDYIDKQVVKGEEKKYLGTKLTEMKEDNVLKTFFNGNILSEEEYDKYYALKDEDLATAGLEITNYLGSYFIINYETYEVIVSKGCKYSKDVTLYKLSDIISKSNSEENTETNTGESTSDNIEQESEETSEENE